MASSTPKRRTYVPVVGPRLKRLLFVVFGLFALLCINSAYLAGITLLEWLRQEVYQDYFYQFMFLAHLGLGIGVIAPLLIYGFIHMSNARGRPNKRAIKAGYALFLTALVLLVSGLVLTRGIPLVEIRHPAGRETAYWLHVVAPIVVVWLFVLHRLAGKRINWRFGAAIAGLSVFFAGVMMFLQSQDPRQRDVAGPAAGEQYFFPSLARTATGQFIPARALMMDAYCRECHADTHERWSHSAHRMASFNNPAYRFSVRNTRDVALKRDGNVQAARFCAGCHDLVPFFSGAFDDPAFDDVNHPTAAAGITCSGCHAITHINSPRGNADYTIEEPLHYPFTYSEHPWLKWLNRTLLKAKPAFHKKTFLKPLHRSAEFCGTCHKVHLPEELNGYKWLRGQNHYDSFLLSGFSGHGVESFYYPEQAELGCNGCHMPWRPAADFGARPGPDGELQVHDHLFPGANTALAVFEQWPEWVNEAHREIMTDALRVDLFGLRKGGDIDGELVAPLGPRTPEVVPGETYLLEAVIRNLRVGHAFTQGTADSNQVWLEVILRSDETVVGHSGAVVDREGRVDRWSHFVNSYVLDRDGNRIARRNAEDIFTTLYNHQIPPGAADVVHYKFTVPETLSAPITVKARLKYRKFDTDYVQAFQGADFRGNDLPVTILAEDAIDLALAGGTTREPAVPEWQRWNDYGIGLLRKSGSGELRQAEQAFAVVAGLGRGEGYLNLARVYLREGRLDEAVDALQNAASHEPAAYPWSVAYFSALVDLQNGYLDEAIVGFRSLVKNGYEEARARGFDFSKDYRLLNRLAQSLFERAKLERGEARRAARDALLEEAANGFQEALALDPENTVAHYGLAQAYTLLGREDEASTHRALHARFKVDDNARDRALSIARARDPAADHAANAVVVYNLQRLDAAPPLSTK